MDSSGVTKQFFDTEKGFTGNPAKPFFVNT
jgi:hypothetical protein